MNARGRIVALVLLMLVLSSCGEDAPTQTPIYIIITTTPQPSSTLDVATPQAISTTRATPMPTRTLKPLVTDTPQIEVTPTRIPTVTNTPIPTPRPTATPLPTISPCRQGVNDWDRTILIKSNVLRNSYVNYRRLVLAAKRNEQDYQRYKLNITTQVSEMRANHPPEGFTYADDDLQNAMDWMDVIINYDGVRGAEGREILDSYFSEVQHHLDLIRTSIRNQREYVCGS